MNRVLIIEDEALLGFEIETILSRAGYEVLGPAATVRTALELIGREPIDAALLDLNLGQEKSFPVADALDDRSVPFVFVTGYSVEVIPERHKRRPVVMKPYRPEMLLAALSALPIGTGSGSRPVSEGV